MKPDDMTLRDYFAAMALPSVMERDFSSITDANKKAAAWAIGSYVVADAMIKERAKC